MMRRVKGSKSRELWDHARNTGHSIVFGVDLDAFISERDTIPNIVSFRLDTPAWLDSLPEQQRQRAMELAEGTSTKELADRWGISAAAVSNCRRRLNEKDRGKNRRIELAIVSK
jgi:DNA-binding CsgD family transcriptional regulator